MKPNVPLGRVMRLDFREWILKDHHTSQHHLGPFDHKLDIKTVRSMMKHRSAQFGGQIEQSVSIATDKVQRSKEPGNQGPKMGKKHGIDLQPFEESPPRSLHHVCQVWEAFKADTSEEERLR